MTTENTLNHIAIIMDGNGRWAQERDLQRSEGHRQGANNILTIAQAAIENGIKFLTLYAFSTENWKRPPSEIAALMSLASRFSTEHLEQLNQKDIKLQVIGRIDDIPFNTRNSILNAVKKTKNNQSLTLTLAISYGGRAEIVDAVNRILSQPRPSKRLTESDFANFLYQPDLPDPDLLIRTGGDHRISNFLLWQIAYAEIYVTPTYWPDFSQQDLEKAISDFNSRKRRFGALK
ncbi:MAG: di-trans,poly-cis-decaprenylcistransferase [Lentisphaerae bacterium]|jgi:undecaprenyl diphosphate synthase|nr:di-trans,poly-cis-decaprenylcistransferase [Lentisphaerota bacterium]